MKKGLHLVWFIGFLALNTLGCSTELPPKNPSEEVLNTLGETTEIVDSLQAITLDSSLVEKKVMGREIVLGCLKFYDPAHGTTVKDVQRFLEGFTGYLFTAPINGLYRSDMYLAPSYLYNVCHITWLIANHQVPWGFPSSDNLATMLWNDGLDGFRGTMTPVILGIGDKYTVSSDSNLTVLIDAWKIGRKFIRPGQDKHDTVVRILHWFKATIPYVGQTVTLENTTSLQNGLTVYPGVYSLVVGGALLNIFQAVGIPALQLRQITSADAILFQLWLPEENAFIDITSLFLHPAVPAKDCLLSSAAVANAQLPSLELFRFLGGPNGRLTDVWLSLSNFGGTRFTDISTGRKWIYTDFSASEISQLRQELPHHVGTGTFLSVNPPSYEQLLDENFPLE